MKASNRLRKEITEATYHFHLLQAHLLLSPKVLEPPLLAHFGQQHAEVWREKNMCTCTCVHAHVCVCSFTLSILVVEDHFCLAVQI